MHITLIEPFLAGSHRQWAEGLKEHSRHQVDIIGMRGKYWKWRMHGGAVELASQFMERDGRTDLILASEMLDLATFLGLTGRKTGDTPVALYFHENQLTYPWSPTDTDTLTGRNNDYAFKNYTSALAADRVFFNSEYHRASFLGALPSFLRQFPDYRGLDNVSLIADKSKVLYLGMDLERLDSVPPVDVKAGAPIILWNHRWEYDKRPEVFFHALYRLKEEAVPFRLVVLGEGYTRSPSVFKEAKERLAAHVLHWGYAESSREYAGWLKAADVLFVSSQQDFFGGSIVEAMYAGAFPILPDRLAYPEHIPVHLQPQHIMPDAETAYQCLKSCCSGKRPSPDLKTHLTRYDWKHSIACYEAAFTEMASGSSI